MVGQAGSPDWKFHRVMWSRGMVFAKEDGAGQTDAKRKGAKQMISKRPSLRDLEDSWHLVEKNLGEANGNLLQYSCLENLEPGRLQFMGSLRVGQNWATSLSLFTFHFHALEKEMATHSSILAWRIPGTGEPGGLPPLGLHRVGHD